MPTLLYFFYLVHWLWLISPSSLHLSILSYSIEVYQFVTFTIWQLSLDLFFATLIFHYLILAAKLLQSLHATPSDLLWVTHGLSSYLFIKILVFKSVIQHSLLFLKVQFLLILSLIKDAKPELGYSAILLLDEPFLFSEGRFIFQA